MPSPDTTIIAKEVSGFHAAQKQIENGLLIDPRYAGQHMVVEITDFDGLYEVSGIVRASGKNEERLRAYRDELAEKHPNATFDVKPSMAVSRSVQTPLVKDRELVISTVMDLDRPNFPRRHRAVTTLTQSRF